MLYNLLHALPNNRETLEEIMREVYLFRFYNPADRSFGALSIAADTEHGALLAFNQIDDLVWINQFLIKFI